MTFSYNPDLSNLRDRIRFELGDTVQGDGVLPNGGNLQDEEIDALLVEAGGDVYLTLAKICYALSLRWARFADVSAGSVRENASQVSKRYEVLASKYEEKAAFAGVSAFAAGVGGSIFAGVIAEDKIDPDATDLFGNGGEYGG